jgi:hypothetical protein
MITTVVNVKNHNVYYRLPQFTLIYDKMKYGRNTVTTKRIKDSRLQPGLIDLGFIALVNRCLHIHLNIKQPNKTK